MSGGSQSDSFRQQTRAWLAANCPAEMRTPMPEAETIHGGSKQRSTSAVAYDWLNAMAERGWTAPMWPKKYGGGELSKAEFQILVEEMRRINARPPLVGMGISMIGPTLLEYGTAQQLETHLPPIIRGDTRWCQGYSEPGAGSDLASLQTKAEDKGDHYLVNGSKIWTSSANKADWMFCLVRTDPSVKKQRGISFLLIDMANPGITATPITLIDGNSHFCQTFFDNVEVPKDNLVGEINKGWTVGKRLLQHERSGLDALLGAGNDRTETNVSLEQLAITQCGTTNGKIADAAIRDRVLQQNLNAKAFALTQQRAAQEAEAKTPGAATSIFKLRWAQLVQEKLELQLLLRGSDGLGWEGASFEEEALNKGRLWLESKAASIAGGSDEVQCNIIAKHVLGLPD